MNRKWHIKTLTRFWPLCLLGLWFLLPGAEIQSGLEEGSTLAGNPLKGRNVFVGKGCVKCHATWGAGGNVGPDLTRVGMGKSLLQIAGALWNHSPSMIERSEQQAGIRPRLTPEELGDFLAYLTFINYVDQPGDPAAGRRLFAEKGCASCHSLNKGGVGVGPALDDFRRSLSAISVAQAMWNHGPPMSHVMSASRIAKPDLRGQEAADLFSFIGGQTPDEIPNDKFMLPGSPATGRRLFAEKGCATCHSTNGAGRAGAPDLAKTRAYRSVVEIAGAMWNHGSQIWAEMRQAGLTRPTFSGNEMADILSYLYFLRYADGPGSATAGRRLFIIKGCAQCHSPQALNAAGALTSPTHLMAAMWNHAQQMETQAQEKGLTWPTFQNHEMRDLTEYVKSSARLGQ